MSQPTRMVSAELLRVLKEREDTTFMRYVNARQVQRVRHLPPNNSYTDVDPDPAEIDLARQRWIKARDDLDRAINSIMAGVDPA